MMGFRDGIDEAMVEWLGSWDSIHSRGSHEKDVDAIENDIFCGIFRDI